MKTIANFLIAFIILNSNLFAQDSLVEITNNNFSLEIRYATSNNFIGEKLYDCEICLLRPQVAEALKEANKYFNQKGYRIKLYDCYRPLAIQERMWEKVPRPTYVANPYTKGSVHNRAAAIDITLETLEDCFVDMGTDYDYFGVESHIDYYNFSEEISENRKLLIDGMRKFGFQTIRTEWWHFSYKKNISYPILDSPLPCEN